MKFYSPSHLTPKETAAEGHRNDLLESMNVADETLRAYPEAVLEQYRAVIEQHFPNIAQHLALYAQHPYEVTIVRIGPNGTFIGYKPADKSSIVLKRVEDFEPKISYVNVFDLQKRLNANLVTFDFRSRTYDSDEAVVEGTRMALSDALHVLWIALDASTFKNLCAELMIAEDLTAEIQGDSSPEVPFDAFRELTIEEPAGFRRVENWGFQFRHHKDNRISADDLRRLETYLNDQNTLDVICLITSGDLTTIGRSIAVNNPMLRVWDRDVLNRLVHKHPHILENYFALYPAAVEALTREFDPANAKRYFEFKHRLEACPAGLDHFDQYERLGTEIWEYIFEGKLGRAKVQRTTSDRVQRRDSLFPNHRTSRFFQRVFDRFDADFIIVDFKNYGNPVTSDEIEDVGNYANDAIGKFVVAVTRQGGGSAAMNAQVRRLRDGVAIITVSDAQMLEMILRKERGENPEDVLSDLLDELLIKY